MNERRRSPRLIKMTNSPLTSPTTSSNSQSLNRPKTSRGRVCLLKNIKKLTQKSNSENSNSQTTRCMKNGAKFSNSRKLSKAKNKKKAARKRRRRTPTNNARVLRRSKRLAEKHEPNTSSRHTLPVSHSSSPSQSSTNVSNTQISSIVNSPVFQMPNTSTILSESCVSYLKSQLKKATIKFDKACRQLSMLDQQMNDLQNSYSNSLENERKTFKIIYRMQLATYEGAHTAYIQYIERQVEKIKKLKTLLYNEPNNGNTAVTMNFAESNEFAHNSSTNN